MGSPCCTPATANTKSSILALKQAPPAHRQPRALDQTFYGMCFAADGKTLFASGGEFEVVHAFDLRQGLCCPNPRTLAVADRTDKFVAAGVAVDAAGKTLFAAGAWGDAVGARAARQAGDRTHR